MKKWLVYAVVLAAVPILSFGGFGGRDVGKLRPVQAIMIKLEDGSLRILTDTEAAGRGEDVPEAIADMNRTADAWVYLDTADYLLLGEGTAEYLPRLREYLRPSCCLCAVSGDIDLSEVGAFLEVHQPKQTMTRYEAGKKKLPLLISEEGRMKLVQQ